MALRDVVDRVSSSKVWRVKTLPPTPQMATTAAALAERMGRFAEPASLDLELLREKLRTVASTGDWRPVTERELRYAGFCLWDTKAPLANEAGFMERYFGALRSTSSRIATQLLIRAYFLHFDPQSQGTAAIAGFLRGVVPSREWRWAEIERAYGLFDPQAGPRRVATAAMETGAPGTLIESLGLRGQLASSPFAGACFTAAAELTANRLSKEAVIRTVQPLTDWAVDRDGKLRFSAQRGALAGSLLLPWNQLEPPDDLQAHLRNFFLATYGDPRISPLPWKTTNEVAQAVMFRWLARGSLEQFLRVVDKIAPGHQWDYRRAFWNAFVERQYVRDAWVAFGPLGQEYAKRLSDNTGDANMGRFGCLDRAAQGSQAVLLLSIGDLIIADWSHNGMLRIWRKGNKAAPSFYKTRYDAQDLRSSSEFHRVHSHPPGAWQRDAMEFIRRHTRIRLEESDYMPKRRAKR